ncbi:hypothetical protein ACHAWT_011059 [Skeletonema menzelii]
MMMLSATATSTNTGGGGAMGETTIPAAFVVVDDDGSDDVIDSPPRPVRTTSSPRQNNTNFLNTTGNNDTTSLVPSPRTAQARRNSASNNFRKYGSIRPPISVLQTEFCTTYRLWEEHDAILRRVELKPGDNTNGGMRRTMGGGRFGNGDDGRNDWRKFKPRQVVVGGGGGERRNHGDQNCSSDDNSSNDDDGEDVVDEEQEWEEAFAHLRTLYSHHHHMYDNQEQQQQQFALGSYTSSSRKKNEFLESLCAIDDEDTMEEKLEEDGQVGTVSASSTAPHNSCEERQHVNEATNIAEQKQQEQQQRKKRTDIENLAKLFRPGSKLFGTIEIPSQLGLRLATETTTQRDYSLVIMEENECDELGRPKGYLARHTCASDEQCVFVHVKFVPLSDVVVNLDDGKDNVNNDAKEKTTDGFDNTKSTPPPPQSQSPLEVEERITIQIDYVDGEKSYRGYWNPNTLSIEGIVKKLGDGNNMQGATDRGGGMRNSASTNNFIMSGLISGPAGWVTDSEVSPGADGYNADGAMTTAVTSSQRPKNQFTFSLSPCTHLHPRGRVQPPLYRFSIPTFISLMGSEYLSLADVGLLGGPNSPLKKKIKVSEQDQLLFMDELDSDDNEKFALHRARTEQLLIDTLVKLTELGALIDFAEFARKRNVAIRREKWRRRMRKVTPKMPRKFKRRKNKEVAGGEEFDLSAFDSVEKKKVQFYDHLAAISWDRLLEAASLQAERTCATFRRRSALLDGITFQSDEYKYQLMSDLRANGLTLASSHIEWDHCIQMGRTVALGWSWFERGSWGCFERSAVVGKRCVHLLFRMHSRLGVCHEQLEKSFRGADARISIAKLESLKQVKCNDASKDDDSEELLCGVCQCDINEADGEEDEENKKPSVVVTLPCSHSFHWDCIREWLHDHSKCPICRVDLNE